MTSRENRIHELLHKLWSKAVGTPDYVKREWTELQRLLLEETELIPFLPSAVVTPSDGYKLSDYYPLEDDSSDELELNLELDLDLD